jgi:hypothetical protein
VRDPPALPARNPIALGGDGDDVAFEVDGRELWIVHLTWRRETDPRWPHAIRVDALPELDDGS